MIVRKIEIHWSTNSINWFFCRFKKTI